MEIGDDVGTLGDTLPHEVRDRGKSVHHSSVSGAAVHAVTDRLLDTFDKCVEPAIGLGEFVSTVDRQSFGQIGFSACEVFARVDQCRKRFFDEFGDDHDQHAENKEVDRHHDAKLRYECTSGVLYDSLDSAERFCEQNIADRFMCEIKKWPPGDEEVCRL
ncbi:hypothetical protein D3C81_1420400 [compost metagenome]